MRPFLLLLRGKRWRRQMCRIGQRQTPSSPSVGHRSASFFRRNFDFVATAQPPAKTNEVNKNASCLSEACCWASDGTWSVGGVAFSRLPPSCRNRAEGRRGIQLHQQTDHFPSSYKLILIMGMSIGQIILSLAVFWLL